mgnify:CR=1 FL=1
MNREVTVEGRLMSGCNTPAANTTGSFHYTSGMSWEEWAEFTTDENGYFKVKKQIEGSTIDLYVDGNSQVLRNIKLSQKDHLDLGEVYTFPPSVSYYLYLEVDSAYTEFDTLTYSNGGWPHDGREPWLKIAGPFQSGIIDTVHLLSNINDLPINFESKINNNFPSKKVHYYVGEYESWKEKESPSFTTAYCKDEYQDVTLKIE